MSEADENGSTANVAPADAVRTTTVARWTPLWMRRVRERVPGPKWIGSLAAHILLALITFLALLCVGIALDFTQRMRSQGVDPAHSPEILFWTGLFTVLLLWWIPKLQAARSAGASADNLFDRENESRKTLAQIVGGVLLLAGLYSSMKTFNLQRDIENLQKEGQITDRYTKAIDQLGALAPGGGVDAEGRPKINLEVRLGGIYALERIAKDSPKDQWTIMEVLTAYVRQNAPVKKHDEASPGHLTHMMRYGSSSRKEGPSLRADIQAILTVIGRRDVNRDPNKRYLDLQNVDLVGAHLMNANFTNASFHRSDLSGTVFYHVDFIQAEFSGALLREAQFKRV